MPKLGVNIDHVATLREARGGVYPDPVEAAALCEKSLCDSIVCHIREDRRHINDSDVKRLRKSVMTALNLEMSIAEEIVDIACRVGPDMATLVPEKRQELTTEGGLDVLRAGSRIEKAVRRLLRAGIVVSLFIDPDIEAVSASIDTGARIIELHTGRYADASGCGRRKRELRNLISCAEFALKKGLVVNAGHGLNYENVRPVARIKGINELNIGHSIVSYAVFHGLGRAVKDMRRLLR